MRSNAILSPNVGFHNLFKLVRILLFRKIIEFVCLQTNTLFFQPEFEIPKCLFSLPTLLMCFCVAVLYVWPLSIRSFSRVIIHIFVNIYFIKL